MSLEDYAISLSWPETWCKGAGAWYEPLTEKLKISRNGYFKVGHAALILVNKNTRTCHYFDFGRYHAPSGFGRVRDEITDHDLAIQTLATFSHKGQILNFEEILQNVLYNESCHGDGLLWASSCKINFKPAYAKAKEMQLKSPILYGPFIRNGTNCSRFVRSIILAGKPSFFDRIRIFAPFTLTASPLSNFYSLNNKIRLIPVQKEKQVEAIII